MDLSISYIYGEAINFAKKHLGAILLFLVAMGLVGIASSLISMPSGFWTTYIDAIQGNARALERLEKMQDGFNPLMLLQYAVSFVFTAALYNGVIAICRGTGKVSLNSFNLPIATYAKFLGWYVLYIIIVVVGCICLIVPGVYLAIRLWQAGFFLIEHKDASITSAMKWSWRATSGRVLELLGLMMIGIVALVAVAIVGGILFAVLALLGTAGAVVGILVLCLAALVWEAVYYLANAMIYTTLCDATMPSDETAMVVAEEA